MATMSQTWNEAAIASLREYLLSDRHTFQERMRSDNTLIRYWGVTEHTYRDFRGWGSDAACYRHHRVPSISYFRVDGLRQRDWLPDTIETRFARWYVVTVADRFDVRKMDAELVALLHLLDDYANSSDPTMRDMVDLQMRVLQDWLIEHDVLD